MGESGICKSPSACRLQTDNHTDHRNNLFPRLRESPSLAGANSRHLEKAYFRDSVEGRFVPSIRSVIPPSFSFFELRMLSSRLEKQGVAH